MAVKPFESLVHDGWRIFQPGVKCRGPEYLRIIYGPEYLEPRNLTRLRKRFLGGKQSLALREYALGLEALERFVAREPLHRVHEAVFAVLALESDLPALVLAVERKRDPVTSCLRLPRRSQEPAEGRSVVTIVAPARRSIGWLSLPQSSTAPHRSPAEPVCPQVDQRGGAGGEQAQLRRGAVQLEGSHGDLQFKR
jgi:hypothetical protein